jgi:hypothetical protein
VILNSKIQAGLPMVHGKGWGKRWFNFAGNECLKCFLLCFILKQLPPPVLPECQPKINYAAKFFENDGHEK